MSAKLALAWSKWAAILEMAVTTKDGIEVGNSLRIKPPLVEPPEPTYEVKITGETETLKKKRDVRNQEKRVDWENPVIKARENRVLCNSFRWHDADAKKLSYIFLCIGAEAQ